MDVQWDSAKARSNRRKHGISFADVEIAFYDDFAVVIDDPDAEDEDRYVLIGTDAIGRVVSVIYTYRGESIRIISARKSSKSSKSSKSERMTYEEGIRL